MRGIKILKNNLLEIQQINSVDFYLDIYKHASSLRNMWIFKPRYIFFLVFSLLYIIFLAAYVISLVMLYFLAGKQDIFNGFTTIFHVSLVIVLIHYILRYKLWINKKYGRSKKYEAYLRNVINERMLDDKVINELIFDIDNLIQIEQEHVKKVLRWYKNFTLVVCVPLIIYAIQNFLQSGSDAMFWGVVIFYILAVSFFSIRSSEDVESVKYIFIKNSYVFNKVKQELKYMKSIKIDIN